MFLESRGHTLAMGQIAIEDARAYIADLQSRDERWLNHPLHLLMHQEKKAGALAPSTISSAARVLRAFGNWMARNGYGNPFAGLQMPSVPKTLIDPLTHEEMSRLVECINPDITGGARNYALTILLLDTGLRASEAAGLRLSHVDFQRRCLKVTGKGDKERLVPFGQRATKALMRYTTVFRPEPANAESSDWFFLSVDGYGLTYNAIDRIFRRLRERANVPRLHAHLLRHTFAVNYLMNGGDIVTLQMILGHESLEITRRYLHLSKQQIMAQHQSFSPMDRIEIGEPRRRFKHPPKTSPAPASP